MKKITGSPSWITSLVLGCFFLVAGAGAWYTASLLLQDKEENYVTDLKEYQSKVLFSESEVLSSQLVAPVVRARELVKARIFRGSVVNFASIKEERRDKAQQDLENFVDASGFLAGHLFSTDGKLLATTIDKLDGNESEYYAPVRNVAETRVPHFSPVYIFKGELVSNLFMPVYPSHVLSDSATPEYVFALVVPLHNTVRSFLASIRHLEYNTKVRLIQQNDDGKFQEITVAYPDIVKMLPIKASLANVKRVEFGKRKDLNDLLTVYSTVTHMPAVNWWIAAETEDDEITRPLADYYGILKANLVISGVASFFFCAGVVLFFSRYRHNKQEKSLAQEIAPMREALALRETINEALPTPVCMRDMDSGEIVYANEAFAAMCAKPLPVILGLSITDLFNPDEADVLQHGDRMLSMSGNGVFSQELEVFRGPTPQLFEVVSVLCDGREDDPAYTLYIFREITEERLSHTQDVEMRQQIIDAMVRAVERVPFLDGHTALLRQLSVEMAETLLLSDADCATVEAAAILSQVGKTFVPREIMQKEGKLTPEEVQETRRYIEHTCRIIEDIEFHLPIVETIWQIQENLDGSGYPQGLKGNDVSMPARILGVANTFSALVKKRSYRKAKNAHQAIDILQQSEGRYDATVIRALEAVVESSRGQIIMRENSIEISEEE